MKLLSLLFSLMFGYVFAQNTETFSDAKTVIKNGKYKLTATQTNQKNSAIVVFRLSEKVRNKWILRQKDQFQKDNYFLDVTTDEDLNNDDYKDVKFSYTQAARGSNEVTMLYLFNPKTKKLEKISNSPDYPNLHYNPRRKCIMSYMFYGGTSSIFLHLKDKKLVKFANVDVEGDSVKSYRVLNGKNILLHSQDAKQDEVETFDDYDPIH